MIGSALYVGTVRHRRLRPRRHFLSYRIAYLLVDLDEIDGLGLRLFARDRFALFSLRTADYGCSAGASLRERVVATLRSAGHSGAGPIQLLTIPRVLGHAFNPISVYFAHDAAGRLEAVVYEVHNTFGERHCYVLPGGDGRLQHEAEKAFHVSPFLPMELRYRFVISAPGERFDLAIVDRDAEGPVLAATLSTRRVPLTDSALLRLFATLPLMTLAVVAGIHFEAARLWLKGLRVFAHRPAAGSSVTVGSMVDAVQSAAAGAAASG